MSLPSHLAVFDTETTGVDTENDRIVTAFVGLFDVRANAIIEPHYWLVDPGVPIPDEAAAVHGYSTEDVQMAGMDPKLAVHEIARTLDIYDRRGLACVAYNARFDFTLLDREFRRHFPGGRPHTPHLVLDPLILDKTLEPYRKGSRKLTDVCRVRRVPVETNAHDAGADCLMAARLAVQMLRTPQLAGAKLKDLHRLQIQNAITQARGFAKYLATKGRAEEAARVRAEWPVVPFNTTTEGAA